MRQTRANEVIFVEDSHMLYKIIKLSQQAILNKFSLQEGALINWTIEESLETDIPEEVSAVLFSEEVFLEGSGEVAQLILHRLECACGGVLGNELF